MLLCFDVDESMYKDQYSYCPCFRCLPLMYLFSQTIDKKPFYDSLDSSDDEDAEKQRNFLHAGKFTNSGTVSSLKSLESSRDWRDNNPFPISESSSDMSVLIELHDEKDHVWSALKKKKKNKVLDDESNSLF